MSSQLSAEQREQQNALLRRAWEKEAPTYEKRMGWFERNLLGDDNREWACSRARGDVPEVAIGTGMNILFYAADARVTGIDLSPPMLDIARKRAADLGREIDLREGDAHNLPFPDASFDSVACTFSLCNIPDVDRALAEMHRVMRPGGRLILLDHIRSATKPVFWIQKMIEFVSRRVGGEHMTRRPGDQVAGHGFEVQERERFRLGGVVERLTARKPG